MLGLGLMLGVSFRVWGSGNGIFRVWLGLG